MLQGLGGEHLLDKSEVRRFTFLSRSDPFLPPLAAAACSPFFRHAQLASRARFSLLTPVGAAQLGSPLIRSRCSGTSCMALMGLLGPPMCRNAADFPKFLAVAVAGLLRGFNDINSDVRLAADESLNKVINVCVGRSSGTCASLSPTNKTYTKPAPRVQTNCFTRLESMEMISKTY